MAMEFVVSYYWKYNTDYRSYLYYSYLLHLKYGETTPRPKLHSFFSELQRYTTIQNGFDQIANNLVSAGIVVDTQRYHLTDAAIKELNFIFTSTFGQRDHKKLLFHGIDLCEAPDEERYDRWVVTGSKELENIFCDVLGSVKFKDDPNKQYRIATLQTTGEEPFVCWGFFNLARMEDANQFMNLILTYNREDTRRSNALARQEEGFGVEGIVGTMIIAAVTYDPDTAKFILDEGLHSIGPINYEALLHYFRCNVILDDGSDEVKEKNKLIRKEQYKAFIEALCKFAASGVVFSDQIISYINNRLSSVYATHNVRCE